MIREASFPTVSNTTAPRLSARLRPCSQNKNVNTNILLNGSGLIKNVYSSETYTV